MPPEQPLLKHPRVDESDIEQLLEQARRYRALGNAVHDRQTRLALLELAFEFEERAKRLAGTSPEASAEPDMPLPDE